jgi:hypothetical protein
VSRIAPRYAFDEPLTFDEFIRLSRPSASPPPSRNSLTIALAPYVFVVAFIAILAATVWGLRVVGGA